MATSSQVSAALDEMFQRPQGLYGSFDDIPIISQAGHIRRVELLDLLDVGDVSGMTCVDFGMGSWGFGSVYARLHGCARAIGIDLSNAAIEATRKLVAASRPQYADRFETYQSDGMEIPLPANSVDLFFSGESIEHVKFPPRLLSEIYRVLREGGQLVVTTSNRDAILYREQGEEYGTSPEHFWLFNTPELVEAVSEFFDIQEIYGFNGSFSSHEEDREIKDKERARSWSREFENEPDKATGIVLRAVRKPGVDRIYDIQDIPHSNIAVAGADTYLPLEFGLKGLLLDNEAAHITIPRPPSDGVVCRLWSHRWSGEGRISAEGRSDRFDLYTFVPGWKNWVSDIATDRPTSIEISPAMQRNPKADADQVIFYEAFTWRALLADGRPATGSVTASTMGRPRLLPPWSLPGPLAGYGFDRLQRFVGTTVFHWFSRTEGNMSGPWQPIGGRQAWDGSAGFWKAQIKEMMMANIDAIYLHLITAYEEYRITFFKAYAELRAEGWDVPKVAPFLDPFGIWRESPIDLATQEGKDAFVSHYIRFVEQYLAENQDDAAPSFLLTVDNRLALATWWVSLLPNVTSLSRDDVETRLRNALGRWVPQLKAGVYMMTTALVDPDLTFSDERMVMFSGYAFAIHSVHAGIDVWHVQAGYWDQNIRQPGYLLPRDGGKNYRRAWDIVVSNLPHVGRVYIESWNEYDEGSGIFSADPKGPIVNAVMHANTDVFSDTDNPYEYVLTTAAGAARLNGRPEEDARFVWHAAPQSAACGASFVIQLVVRNEGNRRWTTPERYGLYVLVGDRVAQEFPLDDGYGKVIAPQRGIVRGEPVALEITVEAPQTAGLLELTLCMGRADFLFGERTVVLVQIEDCVAE